MSRVDWYRAKASEAERKAKEARDEETKRGFAEMAHQWTDIAAQVERQLASAPDVAACRFELAAD
jgi:hypothetical protein